MPRNQPSEAEIEEFGVSEVALEFISQDDNRITEAGEDRFFEDGDTELLNG
jgi:hypothetical protein